MSERRSLAKALVVAALPAALVTTLGLIARGVVHGRAQVVHGAFMALLDASARATELAHGMQAQLDGLTWLAVALTWGPWMCAALVMVFVAIDGTLAKRSPAPAILAAIAAAIPPSVAGIALGAWALHVRSAFAGLIGVAPDEKPTALARALSEAAGDLAAARVILAVAISVATALAVVAAIVAARRGRVASGRAIALAGALFVAALGAFIGTRALAADGAHPLPPIEASLLVSGKTIERVPAVASCGEALEQAPIVDAGDGLALNGRPVTPTELRDELVVLRSHRTLLHPDDSSPPTIALLAPAERAAAELAPLFGAAREAGYASVQAAVVVRHDVETRTLGRIARASDCRRLLALDHPFAPAAGQTWVDFLVHNSL